jgi:hypothetical protein
MVKGLGFRDQDGLEVRIYGFGFWVLGFGFKVWGAEFKV